MPKPTEVNPSNFKVEVVLYDKEDFSVVLGNWKGTKSTLAMRWNNGVDDAGYPKTFGNPMWFIVAEALKQPIIQSLMLSDPEIVNKMLKASN